MLHIHPNARTTPAICAEIARSTKPSSTVARRYGISAETVRKWRKRGAADCLDLFARPHQLPWEATEEERAIVCALRQRGSLTVWFTEEATAAWKAEPPTMRGGQRRYSALAIATVLTLRTVFRLALRQTEGLIGSIIALLGLEPGRAGPYSPEPPGLDAGGASAKAAPRRQAYAPSGGPHRAEAVRRGRVAA